MKLVNKKKFLLLPEGTLFAFGDTCSSVGGLHVKGSTINSNDFYYVNLNTIKSSSSNEYWDILDNMLNSFESCPINTDLDRDGMFSEEDTFLLYEVADVQIILNHLEVYLLSVL